MKQSWIYINVTHDVYYNIFDAEEKRVMHLNTKEVEWLDRPYGIYHSTRIRMPPDNKQLKQDMGNAPILV